MTQPPGPSPQPGNPPAGTPALPQQAPPTWSPQPSERVMAATVIAVTGTGTGVGKTVVTAGVCAALRRRGLRAAAIKPVATGVAPERAGDDAELLALAGGGGFELGCGHVLT